MPLARASGIRSPSHPKAPGRVATDLLASLSPPCRGLKPTGEHRFPRVCTRGKRTCRPLAGLGRGAMIGAFSHTACPVFGRIRNHAKGTLAAYPTISSTAATGARSYSPWSQRRQAGFRNRVGKFPKPQFRHRGESVTGRDKSAWPIASPGPMSISKKITALQASSGIRGGLKPGPATCSRFSAGRACRADACPLCVQRPFSTVARRMK